MYSRVSDILTRVREILSDTRPQAYRWTDKSLIMTLEQALKRIVSDTTLIRETNEVYLVDGKIDYPLLGIQRIMSIKYRNKVDIPIVEYIDSNHFNVNEKSEFIFATSVNSDITKLSVWPTPIKQTATDILNIEYVPTIIEFDYLSEDVLPIRNTYDYYLIGYIVANKLRADTDSQNVQLATQYGQEFEEFISKLKRQVRLDNDNATIHMNYRTGLNPNLDTDRHIIRRYSTEKPDMPIYELDGFGDGQLTQGLVDNLVGTEIIDGQDRVFVGYVNDPDKATIVFKIENFGESSDITIQPDHPTGTASFNNEVRLFSLPSFYSIDIEIPPSSPIPDGEISFRFTYKGDSFVFKLYKDGPDLRIPPRIITPYNEALYTPFIHLSSSVIPTYGPGTFDFDIKAQYTPELTLIYGDITFSSPVVISSDPMGSSLNVYRITTTILGNNTRPIKFKMRSGDNHVTVLGSTRLGPQNVIYMVEYFPTTNEDL